MKNKNLHNITSTGFKTPDDYFKTFDEKITSKLNNSNSLSDIKSAGYSVPTDYFETFNEKVLEQLKPKKDTKVVSLLNWKKVAYISGIAASILLAFNIFYNNPEKIDFEALETASIESYLNEEDLSSYDIASYLNDDDLSKDVFIDNKLSEESLEDYLLQNSTIEDLIID